MDGALEGGMGPAVTFPDEATVAEVAAIEAPRPTEAVKFRWPVGIAYAMAGALGGGAIFAGVTYATQAQFGIVSIIVGLFAGLGAAKGGRSREAQIVGAAAAAIGYFAGQLIAVIAIIGWNRFMSAPPDVMGRVVWAIVRGTFSTVDALFLGIAVYQGWKIPRVRT